jgi:hypothetical protein
LQTINSKDILHIAKNLTIEVKSNDVYVDYTTKKNNLSKEEINKICKFKIEIKNFSKDKINNFDKEKKISEIYKELILDNNIKTFIDAEKKLLDMVKAVINEFISELKIELFEDFSIKSKC